MSLPNNYSFIRYLTAKKSVDDRALNRHVWDTLTQTLPIASSDKPLQILEIGAGVGTMVERMLSWELLTFAEYTAIDAQPENIAYARQQLSKWGAENGYQVSQNKTGLVLKKDKGQQVKVVLQDVDLFDFAVHNHRHQAWDLLVANALLDLMDIPRTLAVLFNFLKENGLFYFTINFDGATILEPPIDAELDRLIVDLYHRSMDERMVKGNLSGDSCAGRHLFTHLKVAGGQLLDAGSSDWVVFPGPQGYPRDEAHFLHFIIATIHHQLEGHPELDKEKLERWTYERHAQVERGELVYIAHQLDFLGRIDPRVFR